MEDVVFGVCCAAGDTSVTYGGNGAGDASVCTVNENCCSGHCSQYNGDGNSVAPHCCPAGTYWDDLFMECSTTFAGCQGVDFCNHAYDTYDWWHTPACVPDPNNNRACCPASMIGDPYGDAATGSYYYWGLESY